MHTPSFLILAPVHGNTGIDQEPPPASPAPPAPYSTAVSEVSEAPKPYTSAAAGSTTSSCAWTHNSLVFCASQTFHAAEKSLSVDHNVVDQRISAPALHYTDSTRSVTRHEERRLPAALIAVCLLARITVIGYYSIDERQEG